MMNRDQTSDRNWRGGLGSQEPHFDDERTILLAQPVIPLKQVKSRRALGLVAAFVVASLLGSAAALALIKIRQPATADVLATEPEPANQPVAQVPAETTSDETQAAETPAVEPSPATELAAENPLAAPAKRPRQTNNRRASAAPEVRLVIKTNRDDSDDDQPRLIDQWQERRQRRVNRPRDPQLEHHSSDLFRIREIFEGPRRSRRRTN